MFEEIEIFCLHCKKYGHLKEDGACPSCGAKCAAYPFFVSTSRQFGIMMDNLMERHNFHCGFLKFRGELECGIYFADIKNIFRSLHEMPVPGVDDLPKLDIVSFELVHSSGERTVIREDRYVPLQYNVDDAPHIPVSALLYGELNKPVFPDAHKQGLSQLHFFELVPPAMLLFARNRLWYAALAQDFYLYPADAEALWGTEN